MEKHAAAYSSAISNKKRKEKNGMENDGDLQKFFRLPNSSKLPLSLGFLTIFFIKIIYIFCNHGFLTIRVIINAINSQTNFPNAALDFQFY